MDCDRMVGLIDADVDGELDLTSILALEAHLAACPHCRKRRLERRALHLRLQSTLVRYRAPEGLRQRLGVAMAMQPNADTVVLSRRRALAVAASAVGLLVAGGVAYRLTRQQVEPDLAEQVVASHIRSLMPGHLTDVASGDPNQIVPWFNGKVSVAPVVADLASQNFELVGGRLDYVAGRAVAALVYRHENHWINFLACPPMPGEVHGHGTEAMTIKGYHLTYWTAGRATYWVVSDAEPTDLQLFTALVQRNAQIKPG
ncbi:anti-sigma factor [Dongia soli]|uniref:Anti-sigma factor n=1 Tax=Dongia soli TaxID=600628 RepID=A0ABU5EDG4_9PROT|nr:anti-sigma factor [Dongia soli]MDY0883926.1 anti-sigma factor [Dongia soli]